MPDFDTFARIADTLRAKCRYTGRSIKVLIRDDEEPSENGVTGDIWFPAYVVVTAKTAEMAEKKLGA